MKRLLTVLLGAMLLAGGATVVAQEKGTDQRTKNRKGKSGPETEKKEQSKKKSQK